MTTRKYLSRLAGESAIYGISGTIARFIGVFLIPVYTRVFSPSEYGVVTLIDTFTGLIAIFVVLGLDNSSARWFYDTAEMHHRKVTIASWFWCQFGVGCAASIVLFSFAPQVSLLLLGSAGHAALIRLAAFVIPLGALVKLTGSWLRYQRRAWTTSIFSTINTLGIIGLTVLFVLYYRWGLTGIYSARLIWGAVIAVVAAVILGSWIAPTHFSWGRLKPMLIFGLPLVPAAIASWVQASSNRLILQGFWDKSEVGLYAIAVSVSSGVALFADAFRQAWGPFAYSILKEEHARAGYARVLTAYAFVGCFLSTGVSLFSMVIFSVLTTQKYFAAASSVPFLTFTFVIDGSLSIAALGPSIVKKSMPIATSIFVAALASLLFNFALVPFLGRDGAAIASMLSSLAAVAYLFPVSQKSYPIPYRFGPVLLSAGFSWVLIAVDKFLVPDTGALALALKAGMCLLFVPLAFLVGLVHPHHLKNLFSRQTSQ
jgi:O-antigen/teichoic acid export membrane protein